MIVTPLLISNTIVLSSSFTHFTSYALLVSCLSLLPITVVDIQEQLRKHVFKIVVNNSFIFYMYLLVQHYLTSETSKPFTIRTISTSPLSQYLVSSLGVLASCIPLYFSSPFFFTSFHVPIQKFSSKCPKR